VTAVRWCCWEIAEGVSGEIRQGRYQELRNDFSATAWTTCWSRWAKWNMNLADLLMTLNLFRPGDH